MRLLALRTEGWRNLDTLVFRPADRVSVLWGRNGQGKTNLIEAIYYLAAQRSFRTVDTGDLVQHGRDAAQLGADVAVGGLERKVEVELRPGQRTLVVDGKTARGASAIFAGFAAVLFVPEDLWLPRAAPAARRRFLDLAVFAHDRVFYREAAACQRVLRTRNALLRTPAAERTQLDTYDEQLARAGARVVARRRALAASLAPRLARILADITGGLEGDLCYRSHPSVEACDGEPAVEAALLAGLREGRAADLRRRHTGFGPHTDDVHLRLGGRLAREHASQGQTRALVMALKLAELELLEERWGEPPVLLLDDVASELDSERRALLFARIAALPGQTFISTTDCNLVPEALARNDFEMASGRILFTPP